jgi:hypothetical protein
MGSKKNISHPGHNAPEARNSNGELGAYTPEVLVDEDILMRGLHHVVKPDNPKIKNTPSVHNYYKAVVSMPYQVHGISKLQTASAMKGCLNSQHVT